MTESLTLLADYFENGSEAAFREVVRRYIDLVYSAAVRLVDGDTHLAEDVAQTVFVDLARMGSRLSGEVMLGGWLHRHTCFVAAKTMRGKRRRESRERQAVEMNAIQDHSPSGFTQAAPLLDEAINRLGAEDRTAILLRFFEQRDFRSVGEALGSNEEAARKRVSRAVEKLHALLKQEGVTLSIGVLGAALATEAATAAPIGLAASISGTVLAGTVAGGATTLTLYKIMALTKLKIAAAAVAAAMATAVVLQFQTNAKLRQENHALSEQLASQAQPGADKERRAVVAASADNAADQKQLSELLQLRGEVTSLKRQLAEAARQREQDKRALAKQDQNAKDTAQEPPDPERQLAISKLNYGRQWMLAFILYADQHQGQFPASFDQVTTNLSSAIVGSDVDANRNPGELEIMYQGSLSAITNPSGTIVIRGQQPWQISDGGWMNSYAFADGHSEIHKEKDGNFEAWERQRIQAPASR
ncbi:MAG: polymerase, sigma-24 subunit, subfamily [Pedosphaera sp.]|nr:polymerase, sigma-24 subunit, subfamily [Pedosphaera sp.]